MVVSVLFEDPHGGEGEAEAATHNNGYGHDANRKRTLIVTEPNACEFAYAIYEELLAKCDHRCWKHR